MYHPRIFCDVPCYENQVVTLSPEKSHYLQAVMRLKPGEPFYIFNGRNGLWAATFPQEGKKRSMGISATLHTCLCPQPSEDAVRMLIFSPIKELYWLVEKAVELGVTHLIPIVCERSIVRTINLSRCRRIIYEACEQSERLSPPCLYAPLPLITFLKEASNDVPLSQLIALDPYAILPICSDKGRKGILIGPEGGWTEKELALFDQTSFIQRGHLGRSILRAETAALAGLSALALVDLFQEKDH